MPGVFWLTVEDVAEGSGATDLQVSLHLKSLPSSTQLVITYRSKKNYHEIQIDIM